MAGSNPSLVSRFWFAFVAFFRTIGSGEFAAIVRDGVPALPPGEEPVSEPELASEPEPEPQPVIKQAAPDAALQLLALLQREGRFIDFLKENVSDFSDEEIGAAARVVHEGCNKAITEHIDLVPIHESEEGDDISVPDGFNAAQISLTGNVAGSAPFKGVLQHRGWRAERIDLPKLSEEHDVTVIAPAEVEL